MLPRRRADKNHDTAEFVAGCREVDCTPHVAQNDTNRCSAINRRTTRHAGYAISQVKRKRIEECFGWLKTIGTLRNHFRSLIINQRRRSPTLLARADEVIE